MQNKLDIVVVLAPLIGALFVAGMGRLPVHRRIAPLVVVTVGMLGWTVWRAILAFSGPGDLGQAIVLLLLGIFTSVLGAYAIWLVRRGK